jgi:hypothetical protein
MTENADPQAAPRPTSVADMLDGDADALMENVTFLSTRIERLERDIVEARHDREEAARRAVEMRAAANVLREVGLRSSLVKGVPYVEMDYQPKRPEGAK